MRVYYNIRRDTILCKRHIHMRPKHGKHTFLAMPRRKLITYDGIPGIPESNSDLSLSRIILLIAHQPDRVYSGCFVVFEAGELGSL